MQADRDEARLLGHEPRALPHHAQRLVLFVGSDCHRVIWVMMPSRLAISGMTKPLALRCGSTPKKSAKFDLRSEMNRRLLRDGSKR
jgi:hypothetical protein